MAGETSAMEIDPENQLAIVSVDQPTKTEEPRFYEGALFGLPREWIVEIRPRKASSKYHGKVDQFFYEPGTRRQFRSLKGVKKHLGLNGGLENRKSKPKASKATGQSENLNEKDSFESKPAAQFEAFHYFDQNLHEEDKVGSSSKFATQDKDEENYRYFDKIAKRVKWQLINGEQNSWDMYVKVPDSVQVRWMNMFLKNQESKQEVGS